MMDRVKQTLKNVDDKIKKISLLAGGGDEWLEVCLQIVSNMNPDSLDSILELEDKILTIEDNNQRISYIHSTILFLTLGHSVGVIRFTKKKLAELEDRFGNIDDVTSRRFAGLNHVLDTAKSKITYPQE